jgi:alkanesulfonate monooxygenase SsuD/methylene tetrahydromethanopterin reductase-like flavin-dependent oxidoreductase (luciferase family)
MVRPKPLQPQLPIWIGGNSEAAMRRAGRMGDGWIPSFIAPVPFAAGVARTQAFAAEAGRHVPEDHFGAIVTFWFDADPARARAMAAPFIPKGRVDDATLSACTAFGPPELLAERLDQYVRGGGSKFIVRPMGPPEAMLDQFERLATEVVPAFHRR